MLALSPSHSPGVVHTDVKAPHAGPRSVCAARSVP